ncbi:helicase associated domain-containing protein [Zunongwangia profunda]|jgi:hypothetical protein|uniref:helicase associated domain-containing protein n=1 Tax=Zunongwangia profunda TaxID=398743 RepID=UPI000C953EAD|nr:helicase associated domain-containing protein [Zunongwangia profunda]MAG89066.1 hypothetical protein [Flavobacteriaceae bacterium]MCC4230969.1 helicase associated domain-containing protein [Zunongwangia profunda]|tara:strand:- start:8359 stop:9093 length:735 start_codon:yes stop_codon:yes gene_type:complete
MLSRSFFLILLFIPFLALSQNTFPSSGNVGIGTTNPTKALDLLGDFRIAGNTFYRMSRRTSKGIYFFRDGAASETGTSSYGIEFKDDIDTGKHFLSLKTAGKLRLTLIPNGNVGIGTTTPDSRLAVNGNIHAQEVKVDMDGWPDFVFEKDYELPTLEEVQQYIKEHGHLENIPSANDVEENGISLGQMNARLLQKIEELTVYTIEQDKQLKHHEIREKELQKQLSEQQESLRSLLKRIEILEKE